MSFARIALHHSVMTAIRFFTACPGIGFLRKNRPSAPTPFVRDLRPGVSHGYFSCGAPLFLAIYYAIVAGIVPFPAILVKYKFAGDFSDILYWLTVGFSSRAGTFTETDQSAEDGRRRGRFWKRCIDAVQNPR